MKDRLVGAAVCWVFATLALTGCVRSLCRHDAYVKLAYQATPDEKSPLSTLKPMTFVLLVEAQPEWQSPVRVGEIPCEPFLRFVYSARNLTWVILEALKNELENNGHTVVGMTGPRNVSADVAIQVTLKKYRVEASSGLATLVAEVGLMDSQHTSLLAPKLEAGRYQARDLLSEEAYESVLNGALAEFIANFSRDPSILAALKAAESKQ